MVTIILAGHAKNKSKLPPMPGKSTDSETESMLPETEESESETSDLAGADYRTAGETCGNCTHKAEGGNCQKLNIQVQDGDSCRFFEDLGGFGLPEGTEPLESEENLAA